MNKSYTICILCNNKLTEGTTMHVCQVREKTKNIKIKVYNRS